TDAKRTQQRRGGISRVSQRVRGTEERRRLPEDRSFPRRNRLRERADSPARAHLPRRFPQGTIWTLGLQRRAQWDRYDGEGQQAIRENQWLGVLHVRPPSDAVRQDGGGSANQPMRRMPRRQRREDRYDLDSVLPAASRQAWLLGCKGETEYGGHE